MCGRFSLKTPPEEIMNHFGLATQPPWQPRYNLAPTQDVGIVRVEDDKARAFHIARWGLVPAGGPGPDHGPALINARSETAHVKSPFRLALEHRRCLIPADGFYEWRRRDRWRQPYRIELGDGTLLAFAGLWDEWRAQAGDRILSCTILTTDANQLVAPIHERMPVLVSPIDYDRWLSDTHAASDIVDLLRPFPASAMRVFPVSDRVNSVKHDDPECARRVPEPLELDLFS